MKSLRTRFLFSLAVLGYIFAGASAPVRAQQDDVPKNTADSIGNILHYTADQFLSAAEAMPAEKYDYIPNVSGGNFVGTRSFAEQVKHVACANFAFFNEIEGKTPPELCEKGGPSPAKGKAELVKYLKDAIEYGNKVCATLNRKMNWIVWRAATAGPTRSWELQLSPSGTSPITTGRLLNTCG